MTYEGWVWTVTSALLTAMFLNLLVWLHWSDSRWWKMSRPRRGSGLRAEYDAALRKHILLTIGATLWPLALVWLALAAMVWVCRWVRFALGGEYPG